MTEYKKRIQDLYLCQCPYAEPCKKNAAYRKSAVVLDKFRFDRARVGEQYGKDASIPRIVMVGIEGFPGENGHVVTDVTVPSADAINPHYNGVKYVLAYLLSDFMGKDKPNPQITKTGVCWIKDALSRYCLCNLYRCAFVPQAEPDMSRGLCHTDEMKKNCLELLIREIRILDPEIVVVQATDSKVFPEQNLETLLSEFGCDGMQYGKNKRARLYSGRLHDHDIHIAQTLHGAFSGFKSRAYLKEELNPVLDELVARVKNTRRE